MNPFESYYIEWLAQPSIIKSKYKICYYLNGVYHRLDGPAVFHKDENINEYWVCGIYFKPLEYLKYIKEDYPQFFSVVFSQIVGSNE